MLTARELRDHAMPTPLPGVVWRRRIALFLPLGLYAVGAGFEWAVLVAALVATSEISYVLRAIVVDTSSLNAMKQDERGLLENEGDEDVNGA